MSRIIIVVLVVGVLVGALVLLSTQAEEVPTRMIETDVGQAPDAR